MEKNIDEYSNPIINLPGNIVSKNLKKQKIGKKYKKIDSAYFVFIDMLGFKETYNFPGRKKSINEVFEYFNYLIEQMKCLNNDPNNCYAGQTSDSLYFYTNQKSYLIDFIKVYSHFNIFSMSKNVFFRGGISKGTLYINKPHQFFGDCVINAYELERDVSNMPRIAIDNTTFTDIKEDFEPSSFEFEKSRYYLQPFPKIALESIDDSLVDDLSELQEIDIDTLKNARNKIIKNKDDYEFNSKTYQKYIYLLEKCNSLLVYEKEKTKY